MLTLFGDMTNYESFGSTPPGILQSVLADTGDINLAAKSSCELSSI
jgi:hypothetical protein